MTKHHILLFLAYDPQNHIIPWPTLDDHVPSQNQKDLCRVSYRQVPLIGLFQLFQRQHSNCGLFFARHPLYQDLHQLLCLKQQHRQTRSDRLKDARVYAHRHHQVLHRDLSKNHGLHNHSKD